MVKSMEFVPKGIVKMLAKQKITPYYACEGVDELLRAFPMEVTRNMAFYMFMLGYIEGKRADRARRKQHYQRQRSKTNEYHGRCQAIRQNQRFYPNAHVVLSER